MNPDFDLLQCLGELEPAWRAAAKLGKDQTYEPELQAVAPDVKAEDA